MNYWWWLLRFKQLFISFQHIISWDIYYSQKLLFWLDIIKCIITLFCIHSEHIDKVHPTWFWYMSVIIIVLHFTAYNNLKYIFSLYFSGQKFSLALNIYKRFVLRWILNYVCSDWKGNNDLIAYNKFLGGIKPWISRIVSRCSTN